MLNLRIVGLLIGSMFLAGCVSWASYPAALGETAIKDPNNPAMEQIMMAGLQWTVSKNPPVDGKGVHSGNGRIALNLPVGVKPKVYRRVAEAAGGGAEPITEANKDLPIYHVSAVRIRGDEAQINIIWPAASLGPSPQGGPVYQEVKLGLAGGLSTWHVVSFREWGPGGAEPPALNFYQPEPEVVPQSSKTEPSDSGSRSRAGREQAQVGGLHKDVEDESGSQRKLDAVHHAQPPLRNRSLYRQHIAQACHFRPEPDRFDPRRFTITDDFLVPDLRNFEVLFFEIPGKGHGIQLRNGRATVRCLGRRDRCRSLRNSAGKRVFA